MKLLGKLCIETEFFALATVQIGIPKRMIYLKNTALDVPLQDINYNESKVLINPIVTSRKGYTKYWEACLSCLDNMVCRPYGMNVQYYDEKLCLHIEMFEGFEATVLLHEFNHLDEILHMDIAEEVLNMTPEKRKAYRKEHPYEVISKTCDYDIKLKIKQL